MKRLTCDTCEMTEIALGAVAFVLVGLLIFWATRGSTAKSKAREDEDLARQKRDLRANERRDRKGE